MKHFTWTAHRIGDKPVGRFRMFLLVIEGQFVLSTVFGWIVLEMLVRVLKREGYDKEVHGLDTVVLTAGVVCSLACALTAILIHVVRLRRFRRDGAPESELKLGWRVARMSALVGALCGFLSIFYFLHPWTMFPLLLLGFYLVAIYIRVFLKRATELLRPGNFGTWSDIAQLLFVYLNLIVIFTLVTLVLQHGSELILDKDEMTYPYGEGAIVTVLDGIYFSVVVMTTLGFGDISPKTALAQIVVIVQTIAGYVMFGLLIGILTRGILPPDEESP